MKSQAKQMIIDEFVFILLGALVFIGIMLIFWATPQELPPSLEPRSISIRMLPNSQKTITFKVIGNLTNVNLIANETLSQIISFSENNFNVIGEKEIKAILNSPTGYGTYSGYIIARGKGGEDAIYVKVYVAPTLTLTSRSFSIEDFKVSNFGNEKIVDSKSDFIVERSLFSSKSATLILKPERMEIEEAKIKIAIADVKGSGLLVVKFNGNVIFMKKATQGFEEIPINVSEIKEMNFINIEVKNEGFRVLSKTSYNIFDARVIVKYKSMPFSFEVPLSQSEIDNFYALEFSSTLVQQGYPSVEIKVNNQKVFIGKLPITAFRLNITKDLMGNNLLLSPSNKVSISLLTEGEIYFSNNIVKIYSYST
ncbi:MAG: hypothetical protein RQ930_01215 [Candidatus Aenigmarchaeota archaeon]|nr:hypothetical protein [Candidatus Aenigmarchaeota archaeon]